MEALRDQRMKALTPAVQTADSELADLIEGLQMTDQGIEAWAVGCDPHAL